MVKTNWMKDTEKWVSTLDSNKATIVKVNMEKVVTYSFTVGIKNTAVC